MQEKLCHLNARPNDWLSQT